MKSLPFALLILGFAASAGFAQSEEAVAEASSSPAAPEAATEDVPEDGEIIVEGEVPKEQRRVCEMQTTTGSIMPKRVCRTVAQIEEDERTARDSLEIIKRDRDSRGFTQLSREQTR